MAFQSGEKHRNWHGGKTINYNGYIEVYQPDHPHPIHGHNVLEHRLMIERHIGRYLRPNEEVHHINGDRQDNRLENLQLMTKSEHQTLERMIDMSDRICSICENRDTGTTRHKVGKRPHWVHIDDMLVCTFCYDKIYYHNNKT